MTLARSDSRSSGLVVRAAHTNDDFIDADIREYRRRVDELRQQKLIAAAAAQQSTTSANAAPNFAMVEANPVPSSKEGSDEQRQSKHASASMASPRVTVRQSRSMEHRQSEVARTMMRRWASLRLRRELLYERERELQLLQQGRIDTTSDQRRVSLS